MKHYETRTMVIAILGLLAVAIFASPARAELRIDTGRDGVLAQQPRAERVDRRDRRELDVAAELVQPPVFEGRGDAVDHRLDVVLSPLVECLDVLRRAGNVVRLAAAAREGG